MTHSERLYPTLFPFESHLTPLPARAHLPLARRASLSFPLVAALRSSYKETNGRPLSSPKSINLSQTKQNKSLLFLSPIQSKCAPFLSISLSIFTFNLGFVLCLNFALNRFYSLICRCRFS